MFRRMLVLPLLVSLLCGGMPAMVRVAHAQDGFSIDFGSDTKAESKDKAGDAAIAKKTIASKADMRALIKENKLVEAEAAYLGWATYWGEDDPNLIIPIERGVLLKQYKDGAFSALVNMAMIGDREAINTLRSVVLTGGQDLAAADLAACVRTLGLWRDTSALNAIRLLLYHEDTAVVDAAITALGDIGDPRVGTDLMTLFDDAEPARCVRLSHALKKLGYAKHVQERFLAQLRFPLPGVAEKAALILAGVGAPEGWTFLRIMLTEKKAPYYPLVLTVMGDLPCAESEAYVAKGIEGNEQETLAALESYFLLKDADRTLANLLRAAETPASVRLACLNILTARRADIAKELRAIATSLGDDASALKVAAMLTLPRYYLLDEQSAREVVRQRFDSPDAEVARAARAALLGYALRAKVKKKK